MEHFEDFKEKLVKNIFDFDLYNYEFLLEAYVEFYYGKYYTNKNPFDISIKKCVKLLKSNDIFILDIIENDLINIYKCVWWSYEKHGHYNNKDFKLILSGDDKIHSIYRHIFNNSYVKRFYKSRI